MGRENHKIWVPPIGFYSKQKLDKTWERKLCEVFTYVQRFPAGSKTIRWKQCVWTRGHVQTVLDERKVLAAWAISNKKAIFFGFKKKKVFPNKEMQIHMEQD